MVNLIERSFFACNRVSESLRVALEAHLTVLSFAINDAKVANCGLSDVMLIGYG